MASEGSEDSAAFEYVCEGLGDDFGIRSQESDEAFIARATLEYIWSQEGRRSFLDYIMPDRDKADNEDLFGEFIQTLSILVSIELERDSCEAFDSARYNFCPVAITDQDFIVRKGGWRLPFEVNGPAARLGAGASADVICAHIAPGHFCSSPDPDIKKAPRAGKTAVAIKKFRVEHRRDFDREYQVLKCLCQHRQQHKHIVSMLAAIDVEDYLGTLLPLAQTDLRQILRGKFPLHTTPSLPHLLDQVERLADALQHVHGADYCHYDLKPTNVLVYGDVQTGRDSPVGRWKLSDFGMGKPIGPSCTQGQQRGSLSPRTNTYQAPEAWSGLHAGSSSDVWSFGCILSLVNAFGIGRGGGVQGVTDFDQRRLRTSGGPTWAANNCFFRQQTSSSRPGDEVNPEVPGWITDMLTDSDLLIGCKRILLKTLTIKPKGRPTAGEVSEL
ncbi:kinase-like protein [Aspergillus homomorphus CBS 101889]|uniref:Kinase-like protein n=1 Tax=Aspergillus homomorphus (strain CBS 101889) TaxID=1450537 RepID=A0A395I603_ASPHC|nr:kinase-like protein [Aspergillus homomorphus CBS 101889]RAL15216.1 kinase-like protein [Aspergillus homomorphus CBS 101889]